MSLGDITDVGAVHHAITEFDLLGRDAFLEEYGFGKASKYFIRREGRWYDSKAIAGAAHKYQHGRSLHRTEFRGGDSTVVVKLESLGFTVTKAGPQPDWVTDELMLALKLYLSSRNGRGGYTKRSSELKRVSQEIRSLPIFPEDTRNNPGFRTPGAVSLKMENFAALDPDVDSKGKEHGATADEMVWKQWGNDGKTLNKTVEKISALVNSADALSEPEEGEEFSAHEGRILFRAHRRYERNPKLVDKKKKQALRRFNRLACEVCDFDSESVFGIKGVIEVHHVVPLHKIGESKTTMDDLALLCPSCHRTVHKSIPLLTPRELAERRKAGWSPL